MKLIDLFDFIYIQKKNYILGSQVNSLEHVRFFVCM